MVKRIVKIVLALTLGAIFLWLAFRNVRLQEVWEYAQDIQFGWIFPFTIAAFCSHLFRAERWRLLIKHDKEEIDRTTLVSGVLVGYLMNIVGPRLGEVSRPMYVAKKEGLSTSKLMGTIVLERIVDVLVMVFLMFVVSVYLISDFNLLKQIFGDETINFLTNESSLLTYGWTILFVLLVAFVGYLLVRFVLYLGTRFEVLQGWIERARRALVMFKDGVLSAREVEHWWQFVFYTVLIWFCYTLMTYIPFWMFDMQEVYRLDMLDALVITVISAIGIAIPSPGGLGTYHYFVKQSLLVLFAVPAVTGIAYATVTHASMVLFVGSITPIVLFIDKLRSTKAGKPVI
ncbi:flippase-like domain-containing protein [Aliifodinibius salicampi]|uniref:Flippase-like domain-containing protein n=1 Tax=Fodinibius salicampi TaxID=1920655 RepID=A0ABT3Q2M4_9BACT|nr:lysylphosphatidylglycerol synthase transmembrane domain-containing protein [Fodinibius salicampi]MCW9714353.1 flippase-like domain-containing protein [Fodinibius salicampi]